MSQNYQSAEFKKLKKLWYEKLKETGFEDAEQSAQSSHEPYLKEWHSHYFQERHNPDTFQIQREYYYRASQFLNIYAFSSIIEREIWAMHASGASYRHIANSLNQEKKRHTIHCTEKQCDLFCMAANQSNAMILNKDKINGIVNRLKEVMMAMNWQEETNGKTGFSDSP